MFDNYDTMTKYQDKLVKLSLWDTAGIIDNFFIDELSNRTGRI